MNSKKTIYLYFISFLCFVLSCQTGSLIQESKIKVQKLDFPFTEDNYHTVVLVDGKLVAFLSRYEETQGAEGIIGAHIALGDAKFQGLVLPDDPQCDLSTGYTVTGTFPDGRLQIAKLCNRTEDTDRYLMAYDWKTKTLEDIAGILPTGPTTVSWNPNQTLGIASLSSGFASRTFYLIYPGGYEALDLTITDGERSWNVQDDFPDFKGADAGTTGDVGIAEWSKNGEFIAFFASPDGIGKTGSQRFSIEYNMYIMGADMKNPKYVFDNVHYPHFLHWSPNSKSIAFIGEYGSSRQDGLWLYLLEENKVVNIAKGRFTNFLWVDDETLVAIKCDNNLWCGEIYKYSWRE